MARHVDGDTLQIDDSEVRGDKLYLLAHDKNGRFEFTMSLTQVSGGAREVAPTFKERRQAFLDALTEPQLLELYSAAGSLTKVMRDAGFPDSTAYLSRVAIERFRWFISLGTELKRRLALEEYFASAYPYTGSQQDLADKYLVSRVTVNRWIQQALNGRFMASYVAPQYWTIMSQPEVYGAKLFPGGLGRPDFLEVP